MALQRGGSATLARTGEPSLQLAAELAHALLAAQIRVAARVQVAGQATHSFECRAGAPRCLPLSASPNGTRGECHLAVVPRRQPTGVASVWWMPTRRYSGPCSYRWLSSTDFPIAMAPPASSDSM